ncbi:hypothetical protein [Oceanimonas doudoroffii]|uniref:Histidine kinase/HSP90-like ATPase domain-containing protein n=1 Tax=Oceanimonas doudoroffii TaxID=84158 RepID=A0A233RGU3_9GAMM|nr:hypothetical protein [Oceanimonas doudoroffii]OXY82599.1 hypothetical protein B6S08_03505 [Oceanimonas doudoroffii]
MELSLAVTANRAAFRMRDFGRGTSGGKNAPSLSLKGQGLGLTIVEAITEHSNSCFSMERNPYQGIDGILALPVTRG